MADEQHGPLDAAELAELAELKGSTASAEPRRERLLDASLARFEGFMAAQGEKPFRARQVFSWLHQRNMLSPLGMSDLPLSLRTLLAAEFDSDSLRLKASLESSDGSVKLGWNTP